MGLKKKFQLYSIVQGAVKARDNTGSCVTDLICYVINIYTYALPLNTQKILPIRIKSLCFEATKTKIQIFRLKLGKYEICKIIFFFIKYYCLKEKKI